MSYNRINYNSTLYNASPEDFAATAKSIIQAHTGPHIRSVVGGDGLSFISDFTIIQGSTPVPSRFYFPDLAARIRATRRQTDDLSAFIRGFAFSDLPAALYPVDKIPDLAAAITALITTDLGAFILGKLAEANLLASIQGTEFEDLLGRILGIDAPNLGAFIGTHPPADLGAIIWAPENLSASILAVLFGDLGGSIVPFSIKDLGGSMLGIPAPNLGAALKSFQAASFDLPARLGPVPELPDLGAVIGVIGPYLSALLNARGGYLNLPVLLTPMGSEVFDLPASIFGNESFDLSAFLKALGQQDLSASLTALGLDRFRDLNATAQAVRFADMAATINPLLGVANLSALISSATEKADLSARLVVDETFITSILTVITLASANLGAVIGNPACDGGSAIKELGAVAIVQHALSLGASIQSFREMDLGAVINSGQSFRAFDTIDITYTRFNPRPPKFRFTDTIDIFYTPFRGVTLGASITATPPEKNLAAAINATFPLLKVSPFKSRITAVDLKANPLDITEILLQLEGQITDFFYVQGLDQAFIQDPDEQWRINIRSFREIAANIFGDREVERICRLGELQSFPTLDEAVRFCITSVLGLSSQNELGAFINASGSYAGLSATLGITNTFSDLTAICNRVFPSDLLSATILSTGTLEELGAILVGSAPSVGDIGATIDGAVDEDLGATITAII